MGLSETVLFHRVSIFFPFAVNAYIFKCLSNLRTFCVAICRKIIYKLSRCKNFLVSYDNLLTTGNGEKCVSCLTREAFP